MGDFGTKLLLYVLYCRRLVLMQLAQGGLVRADYLGITTVAVIWCQTRLMNNSRMIDCICRSVPADAKKMLPTGQ